MKSISTNLLFHCRHHDVFVERVAFVLGFGGNAFGIESRSDAGVTTG